MAIMKLGDVQSNTSTNMVQVNYILQGLQAIMHNHNAASTFNIENGSTPLIIQLLYEVTELIDNVLADSNFIHNPEKVVSLLIQLQNVTNLIHDTLYVQTQQNLGE